MRVVFLIHIVLCFSSIFASLPLSRTVEDGDVSSDSVSNLAPAPHGSAFAEDLEMSLYSAMHEQDQALCLDLLKTLRAKLQNMLQNAKSTSEELKIIRAIENNIALYNQWMLDGPAVFVMDRKLNSTELG